MDGEPRTSTSIFTQLLSSETRICEMFFLFIILLQLDRSWLLRVFTSLSFLQTFSLCPIFKRLKKEKKKRKKLLEISNFVLLENKN